MGVDGLWELLQACGVRADLSELVGMRVAVDASVWLVQFLKAMRNDQGELRHGAHLLGMLARVSRLLYHGAKPVFVFDGPAPALKRRTIAERRRTRERHSENLQRIAEKVLLMQMKVRDLDMLKKELRRVADLQSKREQKLTIPKDVLLNSSDRRDSVDGDIQELHDLIDVEALALLENPRSVSGSVEVGTTSSAPPDENYELAGGFLPEDDEGTVSASLTQVLEERTDQQEQEQKQNETNVAETIEDSDEEIVKQRRVIHIEDDEDDSELPENANNDEDLIIPDDISNIDEEALANMPFSVQMEILEKSKREMRREWRQEYVDVVESSQIQEFSNLQLRNYLKTSDINRRVDKYRQNHLSTEMSQIVGEEKYQSRPISSLPDTQYVLAKKDGKEKPASKIELYKKKRLRDESESSLSISEATYDNWSCAQCSFSSNIAVCRKCQKCGAPRVFPKTEDEEAQEKFDQEKMERLNKKRKIESELNLAIKEVETVNVSELGSILDLDFSSDFSRIDDNSNSEAHVGNTWRCSYCTEENRASDVICTFCGKEIAPFAWSCTQCSFVNRKVDGSCAACKSGKAPESSASSSVPGVPTDLGHSADSNFAISKSKTSEPSSKSFKEDVTRIRNTRQNFYQLANRSKRSNDLYDETILPESLKQSSESVEINQEVTQDVNQEADQEIVEIDSFPSFSSVFTSKDNGNTKENPSPQEVNDLESDDDSGWNANSEKSVNVDAEVDKQLAAQSVDASEVEDVHIVQAFGDNFHSSPSTVNNDVHLSTILSENMADSELQPSAEKQVDSDFDEISDEQDGMDQTIPASVIDSETVFKDSEILQNEVSEPTNPVSKVDERPIPEDVTKLPHFAHLFGTISEENIENMQNKAEEELTSLQQTMSREQRDSEHITNDMLQDMFEFLKLFGIPYIVAPSEAEAQCAFLNEVGLVDAVLTNDSDVFLFGAKTVYRNVFDQKKYVEKYRSSDIERNLGLDRENLILLALLLGSDYTEGIYGIGIVNALEILSVYPKFEGLQEFRDWIFSTKDEKQPTKNSKALKDEESQKKFEKQMFQYKHRKIRRSWNIPENFPSKNIIQSYLSPSIDRSREPFSWGNPDVKSINEFCKQKIGMNDSQIKEKLDPIIKALSSSSQQTRIEQYFGESSKVATIKSSRLKTAVSKLTKK